MVITRPRHPVEGTYSGDGYASRDVPCVLQAPSAGSFGMKGPGSGACKGNSLRKSSDGKKRMKLREKPMREGEWVGDGQIVPWISTMTLLMTACLRRATMRVALRRSKPSRYALIPYYTRFFILHFIAGMSIPQTTPTVCSPTSYPETTPPQTHSHKHSTSLTPSGFENPSQLTVDTSSSKLPKVTIQSYDIQPIIRSCFGALPESHIW
jgi:hypothetical protein